LKKYLFWLVILIILVLLVIIGHEELIIVGFITAAILGVVKLLLDIKNRKEKS